MRLSILLAIAFCFPCFGQSPNVTHILPGPVIAPAAAPQETAEYTELGACRIFYRNQWCGTGRILGYDDEKAWVGTNAHVATSKIGTALTLKFRMPDGSDETLIGYVFAAAYDDRDTTDVAIVHIPGLLKSSGLPAVPWMRGPPVSRSLTFTGSPRCVYPLTTINATLTGNPSGNVYFWMPRSIGGQSGSSLIETDPETGELAGSILLTWLWNGRAAGQSTESVYRVFTGKTHKNGIPRLEGLEIPPMPGPKNRALADRPKPDVGYFEAPAPRDIKFVAKAEDWPIWSKKADPVNPVDPIDDPEVPQLTDEEIIAMRALKMMGFDLFKIAEFHSSFFTVEDIEEPVRGNPAVRKTPKSAEWTPPPLAPGEKYTLGQVHNGWVLNQVCEPDGTCKFLWEPIK